MVAKVLDLKNLSWQRRPFALSNDGRKVWVTILFLRAVKHRKVLSIKGELYSFVNLNNFFFHAWIFQSNVIQGALICLRDASFNLTDLYSLALFAYTFTLAKDPTAARLFKALQSKAIVEGQCGPYNESYLSCRFAHQE